MQEYERENLQRCHLLFPSLLAFGLNSVSDTTKSIEMHAPRIVVGKKTTLSDVSAKRNKHWLNVTSLSSSNKSDSAAGENVVS